MADHTITVVPAHKMDGGDFYRWACSCGSRGKGIHGFKRQAEQAGLDHAKAKSGGA